MREGYELRASYTPFTPTSVPDGRVLDVTRIAIVDSQPAVRAGLTMLLRTEPGLVPVGTATGAHDGFELVARTRRRAARAACSTATGCRCAGA